MEMTIKKLSVLAGISTRTLRYYDEVGILKPARINSSGYRIYGQKEINQLQQVLFYRELGFSLEKIKEIITSPTFDNLTALHEHQQKLLVKQKQLTRLIATVEKTIAEAEGKTKMSNQEKFEGFKQKMIDDNEQKYGDEIREKYGDEQVDKSNQKVKNMTEEEHQYISQLAENIHTTLAEAFKTGDPAGELAQKAVEIHREWLTFYWGWYKAEAHAGLGQMYVDDNRFKAYYDKEVPGTAEFLRDAILVYTSQQK